MARFIVSIDGEETVVDFGTINASDSVLFRQTTGLGLLDVLSEGGAPKDIDAFAALIWIVRRKTQPALTFDQVAAKVTYDSEIEVVNVDTNGHGITVSLTDG